MKKLNVPNINTKFYWNNVYKNQEKRDLYVAQGVTWNAVDEYNVSPTHRFVRACDEVNDGDKVLDIGCGVGLFTEMVFNIKSGCEVWGTDISDVAMHDNWKKNPKIQYIANEVGNLKDIPSNYFNFVFSGEVLEHLDDPKSLFLDAYKALLPGGKFVLTTPLGSSIKSDEHVTEFDHEDIEKLYEGAGFNKPRFVYLPDMEHLLTIFAIGIKK